MSSRSNGLVLSFRSRFFGFTLVELLVAMAVLSLIVVLAASMTGAIQNVWKRTSARSEQFRVARQGLETIASRISQATLNPYWVVQIVNGTPKRFERLSDLRFLAGPAAATTTLAAAGGGSALFFQAPTGFASQNAARLNAALNTWGYFVEYGPDTSYRPSFLTMPVRNRFRLVEFTDPSDQLKVFTFTSGNSTYTGKEWFSTPLGTAANRRVLAENIVALVVLPRLSAIEDPTGIALAPGFLYDSTGINSDPKLNPRHQLPPIVDLAMVAIDEKSAKRITWGTTPPDFGTGTLFQDPSKMDADLDTLRKNIEAKGLSARVFRTSVPIPAARWSTEQTN
jgi:uncharacterized protein (TIGR02599 family)